MIDDMDGAKNIRSLSGGVNQSGLRNHNERLLLSMLQRHADLPGSDLARNAGLSPQTVSVILRKLEKDGLLIRGTPTRGKVGKPSVPMNLAADGVFSIGLKVGRRSADLLLVDFLGTIRKQIRTTYSYPMPDNVFRFLETGLRTISDGMNKQELTRICGIGIAAPFEIWNWHVPIGAPAADFQTWKNVDFRQEVARFSDLPVYVVNDATAACRAEHTYGRGKEFIDYAYFFVGAFIGGGVVLNHSVFDGHQGNAGAFGSLQSTGPNGENSQLIDTASLYLLEKRLENANLDPGMLWQQPQNWAEISQHVQIWIEETARELAKASVAACSVIDFEAILVDGAFPTSVRSALVSGMRTHLADLDTRGLTLPRIEAGSIGGNARAIGAACGPVFSQFLLNTHSGLSAT